MEPNDRLRGFLKLAASTRKQQSAADFSESFTGSVMRDVRNAQLASERASMRASENYFSRTFLFPALSATALLIVFVQSCYQLSGVERELALNDTQQLDPFDLSGAADE